MTDTPVRRFTRLFAGATDAYGTHGAPEKNASKSGKMEIKRTARTVRGPVTEKLWEDHLAGVVPLGCIPITKDGTCVWGCFDVDTYPFDHAALVAKIERLKFPLVVCRSKSGGAHAFLFLTKPTSAEEVQHSLRQMAAALGHGGCEVFPKQTQILVERGDAGNWLNMPYFGGDATERYGVKKTATAMSVSEFLRVAEGSRVNLDEVEVEPKSSRSSAKSGAVEDNLDDGPPCLQHLVESGFQEGTRNAGLFALGTFCKKKFGERWTEVLEQFNRDYMKPPLGSAEVSDVIKNLGKKEWHFKCSDAPIHEHCNSTLCRTRKWGVGGGAGGEYPNIGGLSVLDTDPPLWFADVEGRRVELTTDQLQNYRLFQKVCMERLHVCFQNLTQNTWVGMVGQAMQQTVKVEAPPDTSIHGYFLELLEEFCVNRGWAESPEGLLSGKAYPDEESGRTYFKLSGLTQHLDRQKFVHWGRNKVSSEVRALGGDHFFNLKNERGVRVLWVPTRMFEERMPERMPKRDKDPI